MNKECVDKMIEELSNTTEEEFLNMSFEEKATVALAKIAKNLETITNRMSDIERIVIKDY